MVTIACGSPAIGVELKLTPTIRVKIFTAIDVAKSSVAGLFYACKI
jgi:hypothetical protein